MISRGASTLIPGLSVNVPHPVDKTDRGGRNGLVDVAAELWGLARRGPPPGSHSQEGPNKPPKKPKQLRDSSSTTGDGDNLSHQHNSTISDRQQDRLSMHPPLHRPHPDCQHVVDALQLCHEEHPYAKFWGACNDFKVDLDRCFKAEKEARRTRNMKNATLYDNDWARHLKSSKTDSASPTSSN